MGKLTPPKCGTCPGSPAVWMRVDHHSLVTENATVYEFVFKCHDKTERVSVSVAEDDVPDPWYGDRLYRRRQPEPPDPFEFLQYPRFVPSVWAARFGKLGQPGRMARAARPTPRRSLVERSPIPPMLTALADPVPVGPGPGEYGHRDRFGCQVVSGAPTEEVRAALANARQIIGRGPSAADGWPFNDPEIVG